MSPTLDPEVEELLARARSVGMSELEIERWRHEFDPIALDTCGCKASARAMAVTGMGGALIVFVAIRNSRRRATSVVTVTTGLATIVAKLVGQRVAERRVIRTTSILRGWVLELASRSSPP
jgi:hypothetical protein